MSKIALADLVDHLRNEVQEAQRRGEDEDLRFGLEEVTLEAQVSVETSGTAKAGVKFWIFTSAEAEASASRATMQKIILRLKPAGEGEILFGD